MKMEIPMARKLEYSYTDSVRYADCDLHQHMNHARYFTFMEQARVGYLEALGMKVETSRESIPFILVHASCDYRVPALLNDVINTAMGVTKFGDSSVTMEYEMRRGRDGLLLAEGETVLVMFDYETMKAVPVPQSFKDAVVKLQSGDNF